MTAACFSEPIQRRRRQRQPRRGPIFSRSLRQRGTALIEAALVMPLMLLLALGVADFGRVFYFSIAVTNAARAGAQYGLFERYTDVAGMQNAALQDAGTSIPITANASEVCKCPGTGGAYTNVACSSAYATCGTSAQVYVNVTTQYTFNTLVKYPGIPNSVTLNGHAEIRAR